MTWTSALNPLDYWKTTAGDSNVKILGAVAIKVFSIMPFEICPDNLVECAKLYDYYTYGYTDDSPKFSRPHAFVHVLAAPDAPEDIAVIRSAPTVMDLVNDENLDINSPADIAALELWFNAPDPYDLSEADRCPPDAPFIMRSTSRFEISDYVKLDSPGLSELTLVRRPLA